MKNRNKYHAQSQKQAYLFLAPSMLILTVFVFIPLIGALVISVMNIDIYMNNISFAGFGNYLKMFHDSRIGNATFNSFYFALAEVPLQVFDQVYVMTKGGPLYKTETLVSYIYNQGFQVAPYDLGYASSIAVYLFLMVAIITFVLRRFVLNRGTEE